MGNWLARGAAAVVTAAGAVLAAGGRAGAAPSGPSTSLGAESFTQRFGLTQHDVRLIEAGLAIVVLLAIVLVLRIRRRRRSAATKPPDLVLHAFPMTAESWRGSGLAGEPTGQLPAFRPGEVVVPANSNPILPQGWHPVQGDRTKIAYWNGSAWAAYRQWDGNTWVDPAGPSQKGPAHARG